MSVFSRHPIGGHGFASRPLATECFGLSDPLTRHAAMVDRFFPGNAPKWSDALIARTRRHIAGCASVHELALRMALADHLPATALDAVEEGMCWQVIEHNPGVISCDLFAHFRTRAALSLMEGPDNTVMLHEEAAIPFAQDSDATIREATLALSHGLSRWRDDADENAPMRADLPAEHMQEMLWTTAAILAQRIAPMDLMPYGALLGRVEDAGQQVLASHDEQRGPFGQAARLAHQLHDRWIDDETLVGLAQEGHYVHLFALIADRCGLNVADLASAIINGTADDARLLFRAADMPPACFAITLLALRQVRDGPGDKQIESLFHRFEELSIEDARMKIMPLAVSTGLRSAFARLGEGAGR